jgi:hypothetical protein
MDSYRPSKHSPSQAPSRSSSANTHLPSHDFQVDDCDVVGSDFLAHGCENRPWEEREGVEGCPARTHCRPALRSPNKCAHICATGTNTHAEFTVLGRERAAKNNKTQTRTAARHRNGLKSVRGRGGRGRRRVLRTLPYPFIFLLITRERHHGEAAI